MKSCPDLSIVVPAYNEGRRIGRCLDTIERFTTTFNGSCEVIVVDDGSTDGTAHIVRLRAARWPMLRLIALERNRGKGGAVCAGIADTRGVIAAYTDVDLSAPIEQLHLLVSDLDEAEVAIVSRGLPGSRLGHRQSRLRETFGQLYALVVQILLVRGVPDAQCGLKAYRGDLARSVFARVREHGPIFDTEALLIATLLGARVSQRPAVWNHDDDSRMRFGLTQSFQVLLALLRTKLRYRVLLPAAVRGPIKPVAL